MRHAIWCAATAALLFAGPAVAQTSAPAVPPEAAVRLSFRAVQGCPEQAERLFREIVTARAGYNPFKVDGPRLVEIAINKAGTVYVGSYALGRDGATIGEQREDVECKRLMHTLAVAVANAIRPAPAALQSAPKPALAEATKPTRDRGMHVRVGMDAVMVPVLMPSAGVGAQPWVGLRLLDPSISIEMAVRFAGTPLAAQASGGPFRSSYVSGVLAGCWHGAVLFACPMLEVGTTNFHDAPDAWFGRFQRLIVAAGLRTGVERTLSQRFTFRSLIEIEGVAKGVQLRQQSASRATADARSSPPASLAVGLGVAVRLW